MPEEFVPEQLLGAGFWTDAKIDAVIQDPAGHLSRIAGTPMCSHAATSLALKDRRIGAAPTRTPERFFDQAFNRSLINRDPPEHTAIRRLIARAFTKSAVEGYRPQIQATIDSLLDGLIPLGEMDLLQDFALPLPTAVITSLMGLDPDESEWLGELSAYVEEANLNEYDPECYDRGEAAMIDLFAWMHRVLDARITNPSDDLLSRIASGESGDSPIERDDLVANALFLIGAGQDSTKNTLVSCVYELLRHPDQMDLLRTDLSLAPSAVEEALRFHPAIYGAQRYPKEDIEFPQGILRTGTKIDFFFGPANRDPSVFTDPDRFDITRTHNPHLSFAAGPHHCVGAPLARLELQMALRALVQRLPNLRMTAEPRWRSLIPFRGLEALHVAWDPVT